MSVATEFPHAVEVLEDQWIPMSDGTRLAATIWLPEGARDNPVPAILEPTPYRRNDLSLTWDAPRHAYFAGHGYASVRVDIRGSGDSDGILHDEYLPLEQQDGLETIRWLADQPWCTGRVGLIGISWSGFGALQLASHAPPELGAIISCASTDDRYADDVHYMGGCVLAWDMLSWASTMLVLNALPPDPRCVGDEWRETWFDRLRQTPPYIEHWLGHQTRDTYWKQGSVCEDYESIKCPVYIVGGWADAYRNTVFRFLEGYRGPTKGLIGPWGHQYPQVGSPGPAIGFLQEAVRWWDYWLKDLPNGIMNEPPVRAWMQDAVRPSPSYSARSGNWLALEKWPSTSVQPQKFSLGERGLLSPDEQPRASFVISGTEANATDTGVWSSFGGSYDFPSDQRAEDGLAVVFETDPLIDPIEILGRPRLCINVAADRPFANLAVRLCDVWPDGASTLISRGFLNLTHRASHEHPEQLEPGISYLVEVPLNAAGYSLPADHRLRLAITPNYWPWIWPAPEPVELTLSTGHDVALEIPIVVGPGENSEVPDHFYEPQEAALPNVDLIGPEEDAIGRTICRDVAKRTVEIEHELGYIPAMYIGDSDLTFRGDARDRWRIQDDNPLSAWTESERRIELFRGDWRIRIETRSTMSATRDDFIITNSIDAYEGDIRVFTDTSHAQIPRNFV